MIKAFPKIFAIGTDYISGIFDNEVEITEKIDGSQFSFGKIGGELIMRSKGAMLYPENPQKMFNAAMDYVQSIEDKLPENRIFYCEYLQSPKHNTIKYDRIPKNHLALFATCDVSQKFTNDYNGLILIAAGLGIDVVPLLYRGKISNPDALRDILNSDSLLGCEYIEGIVVKNYEKQFLLGGQPMALMAGKYVCEKFKEVHRSTWDKENKPKGRWDTFKESYKTEARWEKARQHLAEQGLLTNTPKDIGVLIKEVQQDIIEEEKEIIQKQLWKEFSGELLRKSTGGLPEWYKQQLLERSFD